jgi:hypothetical protein
VGEFVDVGVSGSKDHRPQLDAMMRLAQARKVDYTRWCYVYDTLQNGFTPVGPREYREKTWQQNHPITTSLRNTPQILATQWRHVDEAR